MSRDLASAWTFDNLFFPLFGRAVAHTPDNSFMGFVSEELNETEKQVIKDGKASNMAVVYGKEASIWKVSPGKPTANHPAPMQATPTALAECVPHPRQYRTRSLDLLCLHKDRPQPLLMQAVSTALPPPPKRRPQTHRSSACQRWTRLLHLALVLIAP